MITFNVMCQKDLVGKPYVEVRTGSFRLPYFGVKLKGEKVSNHKFRENKKFIEQMKRMEELNNFLLRFEFKTSQWRVF